MVRSTLWALVAQIVRLATTVVLIAVLRPAERGLQSLLVLLPTLAATLSMLGLPGAIPVVLHRGADPRRLLQTIWCLGLLIASAVGIAMIPALPVLTLYLQRSANTSAGIQSSAVLLGYLMFVPTFLVELLRSYVVAQQRMRAYATSQIVQAVGQLVLAVILVAFLKRGAMGAFAAMIAGSWLALAQTAMAIGDPGSFLPRLDRALIAPLFRLGLKAHVGNTVQLLNYRLDALLIGPLLHTAAVGHYTTAVTLAELVWNIPNAVAVTLLPRVAMGQRTGTGVVARHTLLLSGGAALALLIGVWPLLLFINPQYLPAWPPLAVLLPGILALSLSKVVSSDLGGRGLPQYASAASAVSLVITIVGDLLLIPRVGITGAALVSTIAYTLSTCLTVAAYLRVSGTRLRELMPGVAELTVYRNLLHRLRWRPVQV